MHNSNRFEAFAFVKKHGECRADLRISLELNDGVKVNYGKFGDLLVEVKTVTGKKAN